MHDIATELKSIVLGEPAHFGGLTIFPLFRSGETSGEPGYTLLEDAVSAGTARVVELHQGGSVPELRFENRGEKPVLLLDGEELLGAKQNRTVNLTILAPAGQSIVIPVSCVEAGRWHAQSEEFRPAPHIMYSTARAARAEQVTQSMASGAGRHSDQSAVWEEIAAKSQRLRASSPTQAMAAMYDSRAVPLEAYLRAFRWSERQAGMLFAAGPRSIGLDLLDHPDTMRRVFPKLIRSYALDAMEGANSAPAGKDAAAAFLDGLAAARPILRPAVGVGKDVRLTAPGAAGAALWAEHRYVHLCAFASRNSASQGYGTRINRAAARRARHLNRDTQR